jgi:hypothetical protein
MAQQYEHVCGYQDIVLVQTVGKHVYIKGHMMHVYMKNEFLNIANMIAPLNRW